MSSTPLALALVHPLALVLVVAYEPTRSRSSSIVARALLPLPSSTLFHSSSPLDLKVTLAVAQDVDLVLTKVPLDLKDSLTPPTTAARLAVAADAACRCRRLRPSQPPPPHRKRPTAALTPTLASLSRTRSPPRRAPLSRKTFPRWSFGSSPVVVVGRFPPAVAPEGVAERGRAVIV
eukprot:CAMPEP_0172535030 /NCGR_PEP_ID=MMETSP1067-20121228/7204_1 /TAXON_ID=265564 ORGANISM="Thalassiosira punctigera, Strain Tpunct2005C2" /NCGR_SAMPLE_ID=MMETSP1067 /ASSEMBLY_ACC=CAM_ASM_000444 /LENGTH=176 /DNA_ID=CAMNT_0013319919 /DNA_START=493 /DNA_END=1022 /DNA_ORIENTATION=+